MTSAVNSLILIATLGSMLPGAAAQRLQSQPARSSCSEPATFDCNDNGVADACDIASATSDDCNADAVPDECSWSTFAEYTALQLPSVNTLPSSLAADGPYIIRGQPEKSYAGTASGAAYVFEKRGDWQYVETIGPAHGATGDGFGYSMAVRNNTAVIGAATADAGAVHNGAAYVFERRAGHWVQTAKLAPEDDLAEQYFGAAVSLAQDLIAVATRNVAGATATGAVQLFRRAAAPESTTWERIARIRPAESIAGDYFGASIAVDGGDLIVGALERHPGMPTRHVAYIYRPDPNDPEGEWQQVKKIVVDGGFDFGVLTLRVAMRGNVAVLAGYTRAYTIQRVADQWSDPVELPIDWAGAGPSPFGDLAMTDEVIVLTIDERAGSSVDDAAFVFRLKNGAWRQDARLVRSDDAVSWSFGWRVAASDTAVVIAGANLHDLGRCYVYSTDLATTDCDRNGTLDDCDISAGAADCNADGTLDACSALGDLDVNGDVDVNDAVQIVGCLTGPGGLPPADCCLGDLDGDGDLDLVDVAVIQRLAIFED